MGCHILLTGKFKDLTNFSKPDFFCFLIKECTSGPPNSQIVDKIVSTY